MSSIPNAPAWLLTFPADDVLLPLRYDTDLMKAFRKRDSGLA